MMLLIAAVGAVQYPGLITLSWKFAAEVVAFFALVFIIEMN